MSTCAEPTVNISAVAKAPVVTANETRKLIASRTAGDTAAIG
jgi:hypothetical protein